MTYKPDYDRQLRAKRRAYFKHNPPTVTEKECSQCGKLKSADEFHRKCTNADGLRPECKQCNRKQRIKRMSRGVMKPEYVDYIVDLFDGKCVYCGAEWEVIDHLLPVKLGGTYTITNIVPSCAKCNYSKSDKHPVDFIGEEALANILFPLWRIDNTVIRRDFTAI